MQPPRLQRWALGVPGHESTRPMSSFQLQHGEATRERPPAPQIYTAHSPRSAPLPPGEELPSFQEVLLSYTASPPTELHTAAPGPWQSRQPWLCSRRGHRQAEAVPQSHTDPNISLPQ